MRSRKCCSMVDRRSGEGPWVRRLEREAARGRCVTWCSASGVHAALGVGDLVLLHSLCLTMMNRSVMKSSCRGSYLRLSMSFKTSSGFFVDLKGIQPGRLSFNLPREVRQPDLLSRSTGHRRLKRLHRFDGRILTGRCERTTQAAVWLFAPLWFRLTVGSRRSTRLPRRLSHDPSASTRIFLSPTLFPGFFASATTCFPF